MAEFVELNMRTKLQHRLELLREQDTKIARQAIEIERLHKEARRLRSDCERLRALIRSMGGDPR